jgi:hypothetical protein
MALSADLTISNWWDGQGERLFSKRLEKAGSLT